MHIVRSERRRPERALKREEIRARIRSADLEIDQRFKKAGTGRRGISGRQRRKLRRKLMRRPSVR